MPVPDLRVQFLTIKYDTSYRFLFIFFIKLNVFPSGPSLPKGLF